MIFTDVWEFKSISSPRWVGILKLLDLFDPKLKVLLLLMSDCSDRAKAPAQHFLQSNNKPNVTISLALVLIGSNFFSTGAGQVGLFAARSRTQSRVRSPFRPPLSHSSPSLSLWWSRQKLRAEIRTRNLFRPLTRRPLGQLIIYPPMMMS